MTYSKAFTTLWFWRSEIVGKFQKSCQKQSNVDAPWCVIYIPLLPYSHKCTRTLYGSIRHIGSIIHIGVGSGVARFDRMGTSYEPQNVKRATVCRASRLNRNVEDITLIIRCTMTETLWIDTIKFPLFFIQSFNVKLQSPVFQVICGFYVCFKVIIKFRKEINPWNSL